MPPDYNLRMADRLGTLVTLQRQLLELNQQTIALLESLTASPTLFPDQYALPEPEPEVEDEGPEEVVAPTTDELLRQLLIRMDRLESAVAAPRRRTLVYDALGKPVESVEVTDG